VWIIDFQNKAANQAAVAAQATAQLDFDALADLMLSQNVVPRLWTSVPSGRTPAPFVVFRRQTALRISNSIPAANQIAQIISALHVSLQRLAQKADDEREAERKVWWEQNMTWAPDGKTNLDESPASLLPSNTPQALEDYFTPTVARHLAGSAAPAAPAASSGMEQIAIAMHSLVQLKAAQHGAAVTKSRPFTVEHEDNDENFVVINLLSDDTVESFFGRVENEVAGFLKDRQTFSICAAGGKKRTFQLAVSQKKMDIFLHEGAWQGTTFLVA